MTEDEKTDLWCVGRVNGLGDKCAEGSYVGLVYQSNGARQHIRISTGGAHGLIAELQAALSQKDDAALRRIMRDVRSV